MEWFVRRWRLSLLALILATLCLLIYVRTQKGPTVGTFMQYFRRDKTNTLSNGFPKSKNKRVPVRVLDYSTFPKLDRVDCVPLKSSLLMDRLCIYDENTDIVVSSAVRKTGVWEGHILKTLNGLLAACPDCQFLDIGANIGVYTVTVASQGRTVVAVEPLYNNLLRLTKSIRMNNMEYKVTIIANPVSDVYENVALWLNIGNPGGTEVAAKDITMSPLSRQVFDRTFRKLPEILPTIHLDDLVPLVHFKKAIMKVDIQGYEIKAFRKAAKLFETIEITHVFMEWYGKNSLPLDDIRPLIDFFTSRGYIAHSVDLTVLPSDLEGYREWPQDIIWVSGR